MRSINAGVIIVLLCGAIAGGCSKKPELVEPPPPPFEGKAAWILKPGSSTTLYYGCPDTIRWGMNPFAKSTRVYVEFQMDSAGFLPWFDAQADSLFRWVRIPFEPFHRYRFRIRGNTGSEWDTSASIVVYGIHRIVFPTSSLTLTPGMRIKIWHTAYGNPPLALEYAIQGPSGPMNWTRLPYSRFDPEFLVTRGMASQGTIYLRLRDTATAAEYSSGKLTVRDFVNPEFGLSPPIIGNRFIAGREITLVPASMHGPVAFDLSSNSGASWQEIIPMGGVPLWRIQIAKPAVTYRLRMRADDPSFPIVLDLGDFEIDTILIQFLVTWPHEGVVLRAGDYIHPAFVSAVGDSVIFSLSTDDGATWTSTLTSPTPIGYPDSLFLFGAPSTRCRIRIQTLDGRLSRISEQFAIEDRLADFFPVDVGSRWVYSHRTYGEGYDNYTFRIIEVTGKHLTGDAMAYTCLVKDSSGGSVTGQYEATFFENLTGLHIISASYYTRPLDMQPARYFHPDFGTILLNRYSAGRDSRSTKIEKGIGFRSYSNRQYIGLPARYQGEEWNLVK